MRVFKNLDQDGLLLLALLAADVSSDTHSSSLAHSSSSSVQEKVRGSPRSVQDADGTSFHHPATGDVSFSLNASYLQSPHTLE